MGVENHGGMCLACRGPGFAGPRTRNKWLDVVGCILPIGSTRGRPPPPAMPISRLRQAATQLRLLASFVKLCVVPRYAHAPRLSHAVIGLARNVMSTLLEEGSCAAAEDCDKTLLRRPAEDSSRRMGPRECVRSQTWGASDKTGIKRLTSGLSYAQPKRWTVEIPAGNIPETCLGRKDLRTWTSRVSDKAAWPTRHGRSVLEVGLDSRGSAGCARKSQAPQSRSCWFAPLPPTPGAPFEWRAPSARRLRRLAICPTRGDAYSSA